jgi:hypothetical protein
MRGVKMPTYTVWEDNNKFRELILYIAKKSEGDDTFGATKLNKLLFFSDILSYLRLGKSISFQEYQCIERGPAPRKLLPIRDELIAEGSATIEWVNFFGYPQEKLIATREPDLKSFPKEEIDIVDEVINQWWGTNGSTISKCSHELIGWQYADEGETIIYETSLISNRDLTEDEEEFASKIEVADFV